MKSLKNIAMLAGAILLVTTACKKEDKNNNPTTPSTGEFVLEIENVWGPSEDPFGLGTTLIHPMTGDSLDFSTLKYYVSNIKLQDVDGNWWTEEESYYLVDASVASSLEINLSGVPAKEYVGLEITLGVDSTRNVSGAQTGALDPANNMFWSWNNGYIMVKAEGTSPQSATGTFAYHLGGFTGPDKAVNTLMLDFSSMPMTISPNAKPQMHTKINVARLWHTVGSVANGQNVHSPGQKAGEMATDFQTSLYIHHIHN